MQIGRPDGGLVVAVSIDAQHRFSKTPRLSIALVKDLGVQGDAHFGQFVKHRYLARRNPRAPNLRQVHLIPGELLEALRADGYDVAPGELGENITTAGLDLERLPLDTELRIGADVSIRLTGLRTPCVLIDRLRSGLKARLVDDGSKLLFKAGVMGIVAKGGEASPGDAIGVLLPDAPLRPLPPL
jgi:MOSC domain-containing protein YiiM